MDWTNALQTVGDVANAGAGIIRKKADRASETNNAPIAPSETRMQPWIMYGGAALFVLVLIALFRRR